MQTQAGVKLTENQAKLVKSMERLLNKWDRNLSINCIGGCFYIMLEGDTEQNPEPEMSPTGGFNPNNIVFSSLKVKADGGDW